MVSLTTGAGILAVLAVGTTVVRRRKLEGLDSDLLRRLGFVSGVAAPTLALSGIVVGVLTTPEFGLASHTLSDLGVQSAPASWYFNGAMILTGLTALPFGVALLLEGNTWERVAVVCLAVAMNGLNMIGLFHKGNPMHVAGGVMFYASFTVGFYLFAVGNRHANPRQADVTLFLAVLHTLVWTVWGLVIAAAPPAGNVFYASGSIGPQVAGALALSIWTVWIATSRFAPDRPVRDLLADARGDLGDRGLPDVELPGSDAEPTEND